MTEPSNGDRSGRPPARAGGPQLLWRAAGDGRWTWSGSAWGRTTGMSEDASHGFGWIEAVHAEDRASLLSAFARHGKDATLHEDARIRIAGEGRFGWFRFFAETAIGADGAFVEWVGSSTRIDDLQTLQMDRERLLSELQHRVRNTLAVVRSIARRTAETAETADELAMHLDGRLTAFSQVQTALVRNPSAGIALEGLVFDQLRSFIGPDVDRLSLSGPDLRVKGKAAELIGLMIHELATNAVKFGALRTRAGNVNFHWNVLSDPAVLRIRWKERGVAITEPPVHAGFGTEFMTMTLPFEAKAVTTVDFEPDGVLWSTTLPLAGRLAGEILV